MAKKRKLVTETGTSTAAAASSASTQPKKLQNKAKEVEEQPPAPPQPVEEEEVVEEEVEEEEYEEVEEEEEEEEDDDEEEEEEGDDGKVREDGDDEPIWTLLELFTREQISSLLGEAAEKHGDVAAKVRKLADEDTVHRKIFVHGLGWDATADTLRSAFQEYGEIEDCKCVVDKVSGKSKGYGFILFRTRGGARNALKEPQKKIGGRMTACQLAAVGPGPGPGPSGAAGPVAGPVGGSHSEVTQRKIYVSNVSAEVDPGRLTAYFAKFGEIEEGPLGIDKSSGKFKGFCLFVYKSVESARKALEEPHKNFEGITLHCQKAIDGPKPGKQQQQQGAGGRGSGMGGHGRGGGWRNDVGNSAGPIVGPPPTGAGLMGMGMGVGAGGVNPVLGQALSALLASQNAGLGFNNLLGTLGAGAGMGVPGSYGTQPGAYGAQGGVGVGVMGGYGAQAGLPGAYPNQQLGHGGSSGGRSQHGYNGGVAPYGGR